MSGNKLLEGLRGLSAGDRRLLLAFVGLALLTLALGLIYGAVTVLQRAGFLALEPSTAYAPLTLHGVTIFFYWLYFIQGGLVLALTRIYTRGADAIALRPAAWLGFVLMAAGFVLDEAVPYTGVALLYNAPPDLVQDWQTTEAGMVYLGYLCLGAGLFLVALSAVATAVRPKLRGAVASWSTISFAVVAWAGLLMVSAAAAANAFLPAALWAFGLAEPVSAYTMSWHILFHNVHYLPLMATVVLWYVLVEAMTGVKSIFGERFSKVVFASYLIFVPPTSLYHMFLEPNLAEAVKVGGSLLSLFISVPTVLVFLVIVASLEVHARAQGARGLFGWLRMLPWRNPAMSAVAMAVVNLALGGALSFVLIQEHFASMLSDTFFVPAYFHFLTLGTVTLTLVAALVYVIPGLTRAALWRPAVLVWLPYAMTLGLAVFGLAGVAAGLAGVPRRAMDISYGGAAPEIWGPLMAAVGAGGALMAASLAVYVYGLARTLLGSRRTAADAGLVAAPLAGGTIAYARAWFAPAAVAVLVGIIFAMTSALFEFMEGLPIMATGGGH